MAEIKKVYLGNTALTAIYAGANKAFDFVADTTAPITTPRPVAGTFTSAQTVYLDVNEPCTTYYTTNGDTPTIGGPTTTLYTGAITLNSTTTLKYFSVDNAGNVEAVKTSVYTISVGVAPTTTISPTATAQNSIPITVTLSTSESGATIYYKLGDGTTLSPTVYTYSGPFTVNQNSAGVQSTQIQVNYWAVGANATEAEKSIVYDTSGAVPAAPTVTATAGNNQVALSWAATANTTSYTVYRSTTAPTLGNIATYGTLLSQYQAGTTYTDTTAVNGTTYYYTVEAGNFQTHTDTIVSATPTSGAATGWSYVKITMYGDSSGNLFRVVEWEVWNQGNTTNLILNKAPYATTNASFAQAKTTAVCTDGDKNTANRFAFMDNSTTTPATCTYQLTTPSQLGAFKMWNYSTSSDLRKHKFKVEVSKNNSTWTLVADYSTNTTVANNADGFFPNAINFPTAT